MSPVRKSTCRSFSDRGSSRHMGFAKAISALALSLLIVSLLASPAVAQESGVTHQNPDYPSGPPYSSVPSAETFKFRNLGTELRNKMTGTYTVSSTGDLFFMFPVSQRM